MEKFKIDSLPALLNRVSSGKLNRASENDVLRIGYSPLESVPESFNIKTFRHLPTWTGLYLYRLPLAGDQHTMYRFVFVSGIHLQSLTRSHFNRIHFICF